MASFSQRQGLEPISKLVQLNGMDQDLRNGLWSTIHGMVFERWQMFTEYEYQTPDTRTIEAMLTHIWIFHLKQPADAQPRSERFSSKPKMMQVVRDAVLTGPWNKAFDMIEQLLGHLPQAWLDKTTTGLNFFLERENSAYRVIGREFVPISDDTEVDAVSAALSTTRESEKAHFKRALELLSDRASPDYRNSIKESISAVESACQSISGDQKASLGECLGKIKRHHRLHQSFEKALHQLYGFTSDASGIRHALTDGDVPPTYADAKFMLVSCTTFVNYLWNLVADAPKQLT